MDLLQFDLRIWPENLIYQNQVESFVSDNNNVAL